MTNERHAELTGDFDYDTALSFIALQDERARPLLCRPDLLAHQPTVRMASAIFGVSAAEVARDCIRFAHVMLEAIDEA